MAHLTYEQDLGALAPAAWPGARAHRGVKKRPRGQILRYGLYSLEKAGITLVSLAPVRVPPAAARGRGQCHAPTHSLAGGTNQVRHLLREEVGLGARVTRCAQGPVISGYLGHILQVLVDYYDTLDHGRESHGADLPDVVGPDLEELLG